MARGDAGKREGENSKGPPGAPLAGKRQWKLLANVMGQSSRRQNYVFFRDCKEGRGRN